MRRSMNAHASIHDDATAKKLGLQGRHHRGPDPFQPVRAAVRELWGERGSRPDASRRTTATRLSRAKRCRPHGKPAMRERGNATIQMVKRDGTEVLRGTASVGSDDTPTALDRRLTELKPLADPVILRDVKVGMKTARADGPHGSRSEHGRALSVLAAREAQGDHRAVRVLRAGSAAANPWGRAVIPIEMLSVLFQYSSRQDRCRSGARRSGCSPTRRSGCTRARCSSARSYRPNVKSSR